jgi:hypothetical protein
MIDTFAVWTPFEVGLAKSNPNPNGGDAEPLTARIGGIISMETKDQQGETLLQDGLDWSYFLEKGWFNYEHRAGPDNVLGHPETVTSVRHGGKPATRVEGVLYLAKAKARDIYETAQAMQKAGTSRRLGFSVEGQVVQRDGMDSKRIKKARVLNVALTAHPVHPDARLEVLVRSLMGAGGVGYQSPAVPSGDPGAVLSPLIPQSIEPVGSLAGYAATAFRRERMSLEELALLLTTTFPHVNMAQAISIAVEIQRAVR